MCEDLIQYLVSEPYRPSIQSLQPAFLASLAAGGILWGLWDISAALIGGLAVLLGLLALRFFRASPRYLLILRGSLDMAQAVRPLMEETFHGKTQLRLICRDQGVLELVYELSEGQVIRYERQALDRRLAALDAVDSVKGILWTKQKNLSF